MIPQPPEQPEICDSCEGYGTLTIGDERNPETVTCPRCDGAGMIPGQP